MIPELFLMLKSCVPSCLLREPGRKRGRCHCDPCSKRATTDASPVSPGGHIHNSWTPRTTVPIAIYVSEDALSLCGRGTPRRGPCGWGGGCIFSCATQTPLSCRAPSGEGPGFLGLDSPGAGLSFAPPSHLLGSPFRLSVPQVPQDNPPPSGDEQPPGTRGL